MSADTTNAAGNKLQAPTAAAVKESLNLADPTAIRASEGVDKELDAKADVFVQALLQLDASDIQKKSDGKSAVENMGADLQRQSAKQSEMLKQPIKRLSERGAEGGDVANALVNLKMEVEELDPGQFDFEPGWFSRALGNIPGVGTPLKRYFSRYESAQTVISAIISSLEKGREQLQRDNVTLSEDQKRMIELSGKLERAIKLGQLIDQKLQYSLERDLEPGSDKYKFVAEELLFPLRQRLIDLQQQLVVNQQGVLATEIIIRNNVELVRGVNRALNVTVSALRVAATVALALANQKIVLDKIEAVNKTTSDLIAGTAARLKTQGAAIHKQASSAQIDMEALKGAFVDIRAAMDDIATFRMNALPQMANTVLELDRLSTEAGKQIADMQKSKTVAPELQIAVE
jgi:uncharacterized protein YaaN involved in tellurite resistance